MYENKLRLLRQNLNANYIIQADNKTKAAWNKEREPKSCLGLNQYKIEINNNIDNPQEIVDTFNTFFVQIAEKSQNGTLQIGTIYYSIFQQF